MPDRRDNESKDDFVARCMSDPEAKESFPDHDQRLAFCFDKSRANIHPIQAAIENQINPDKS